MARTATEEVTIPRAELQRLRRDSAILDYIRKAERTRNPGRTPLPELIGEMMETEGTIQGILAAHVRRLEARDAGPARPGPAPAIRRA